MTIEILGHILQLTGIFFAFLATGVAFILANITRGGATGNASDPYVGRERKQQKR